MNKTWVTIYIYIYNNTCTAKCLHTFYDWNVSMSPCAFAHNYRHNLDIINHQYQLVGLWHPLGRIHGSGCWKFNARTLNLRESRQNERSYTWAFGYITWQIETKEELNTYDCIYQWWTCSDLNILIYYIFYIYIHKDEGWDRVRCNRTCHMESTTTTWCMKSGL